MNSWATTAESYRCAVHGQGYVHDWRLHERTEIFESQYKPQDGAPGYGIVSLQPNGYREVWYCTRCRLVDEREVQG